MAQDLFFFCLGGDDGPPLERERVHAILAVDAVEPRYDIDLLYRDDSYCLEHSIGRNGDDDAPEKELRCLCFSRFAGRMMMERLFALAKAMDVVLVWTDTSPSACVVGAEKLARMDAEIRGSLNPVLANDPDHLTQLIIGASFEECDW